MRILKMVGQTVLAFMAGAVFGYLILVLAWTQEAG